MCKSTKKKPLVNHFGSLYNRRIHTPSYVPLAGINISLQQFSAFLNIIPCYVCFCSTDLEGALTCLIYLFCNSEKNPAGVNRNAPVC